MVQFRRGHVEITNSHPRCAFLRRYARALTGSQTSGDAYVAATLEALIADRSVLDDTAGARVALFRLFTKIWNSLAINGTALPEAPLQPGEQKLGNLMPLPRQAFSAGGP